MIHITNISKQHGSQILFRNASLQILPGTRTGLVGPNGAGKTTVFRLITGEEEADAGEISCAKRTTVGYFSQEVGDMAGRSALAEVMSAVGDVMSLGEEIRDMEQAMARPMDDEAMAELLERYGNAVERFEHSGGYDLESRAQTVLTGLGIGPEDYNRRLSHSAAAGKCALSLPRF